MKTQPSFKFPAPVELGGLNLAFVVISLISLFGANPMEGLFAVIQLKMILHFYWRKDMALVGVLLLLFPWLEISTAIFEANLRGESLNQMLYGTGRQAYWLSAIGLTCVHIGFYSQFKKCQAPSLVENLKISARKLSLNKLIIAYFLVSPATILIRSQLGHGSSIYQFVTYFGEISTVLLIVICLRQALVGGSQRLFYGFMLVVIGLSFYSLFSSWKVAAFALFISFGMASQLNRKVVLRVLILGVIFGNLIFLWQGVKAEYRGFLTGSENIGNLVSQRIVRSQSESLAKFLELTAEFYGNNRKQEAEHSEVYQEEEIESNDLLYGTLRRAGYLEFFAMVLNKVPEEIPHEGGSLLQESLSFALIPRILNSNKGVKDDGAKVEKYTDFRVSSTSSFSLGHYVEYFIDFGPLGMMLVLLIYGWIGGRVLTILVATNFTKASPIFLVAMGYVVLDKWGSFQADTVYLFGQTFFGLICHGFIFLPAYSAIQRLTSGSNEE